MTIKYKPRETPSPRRLALRANKKYYNTGKPCKHGHMSDRNTNNGQCIECYEVNKKANYAKYKENHPDHLEIGRKRQQEHRDRNPEGNREYQREYQREYRKTKKGAERHKAAMVKYHQSEKGQKKHEEILARRKMERIQAGKEKYRQLEMELEDNNGNT